MDENPVQPLNGGGGGGVTSSSTLCLDLTLGPPSSSIDTTVNTNGSQGRRSTSSQDSGSAIRSRKRSYPNYRTPPSEGKSAFIVPPFRWATDKRATVHTLQSILSMGIHHVEGEVQCRRCDHRTVLSYALVESFQKVANRIEALINDENLSVVRKAPAFWMDPTYPACPSCLQDNCLRSVLERKRNINWLFLFLGESLGACTTKQLKYFCKHNYKQRTGSKAHVLFYVYLTILKQLDPTLDLPID